MKLIYFNSLLKINIEYFKCDKITFENLLTSINKNAEDIKRLIKNNIGYVIQDFVIVVSTIIFGFINHIILTLVLLTSTPIFITYTVKFNILEPSVPAKISGISSIPI